MFVVPGGGLSRSVLRPIVSYGLEMSAHRSPDDKRTNARRSLGGWIHGNLSSVPAWALWILAALWTLPTAALLVDSFRGRRDQIRSGFWTVATDPGQLTLDNYDRALNSRGPAGMFDSLMSSFAIAIPATIIPIALAALAAYAFAFIEFRGREWLFIGTVSLMAVPSRWPSFLCSHSGCKAPTSRSRSRRGR